MRNQYATDPTPKRVRIWGRGQFTIPAEIREKLNIGDGTILSVFQVGKAILAVPETPRERQDLRPSSPQDSPKGG